MPPLPPFWSKARHAERRPALIARSRALADLRRWFAGEGFVEVEPAALQASPGNETHLHGFRTAMTGPDGVARQAYLHTSPEFAMKKLLAAGEARIFALARVFRNRERGALHAPEFTMLEWYRAGAPLETLMGDCAAILRCVAVAAGARRLVFRGREADPLKEPERLSVREAFLRHAGLDLFDSLGAPDSGAQITAFGRQAMGLGLRVADDDGWSDIFSRVLSARVEPNLGIGRPTLLTDYPVSEAALAQVSPRDPRLAERFELYACGVELANAFNELTDAMEQRRRFEADMAEKQRVYAETYPIDEDFLAALGEMPPASGAALGFDRLVMLACAAPSVEAVQWTPVFTPVESSR